ncbi:MAG: hypothetical protein FWF83_00615 [Clostridiales bacterium]|nr:hypothetical protein [Clostridiales bacterium]
MKKNVKKPTFLVQMLDTQNLTWQGTITYLDTNQKVAFRSVLELIKLMDSAVSQASFSDGSEGLEILSSDDQDEDSYGT